MIFLRHNMMIIGRPLSLHPPTSEDHEVRLPYWTPFLGGQAPAPGYAMSLSEDRRAELREYLRVRLPYDGDGGIPLIARAWAVRAAAETNVAGRYTRRR
ncbi:MAG TPA: hypothetical protein VHU77_07250 [Candidatus Limnocylindria bacterium]|nr:hypothetical protein [Candidatus Limnocylindria bacterium]